MKYLLPLFLSGCASYGPWPIASDEQLERLLLHPGESVLIAKAKHGPALKEFHFNPAAGSSYWNPPQDFTGQVWYKIRHSGMCEQVTFCQGVAVHVIWRKSSWAEWPEEVRVQAWNAHLETE